jgi:hypothetical protein
VGKVKGKVFMVLKRRKYEKGWTVRSEDIAVVGLKDSKALEVIDRALRTMGVDLSLKLTRLLPDNSD